MKFIFLIIISLTFIGCLNKNNSASVGKMHHKPKAPENNKITTEKIELGKMLFFDPRLSIDGTISCNSCHNVMNGGSDNRAVSVGVLGQKGGRGAPTVFNAAFLSTQFWDGRAKDLEEQAKGPLTNPIEMGMPDHNTVMARVSSVPGYISAFKKVFPNDPNPVNIDNLAKAIATYERTLITTNSPFDQFMAGNKSALTELQKKGWDNFKTVGCNSCHGGNHFAGPDLPLGQGFFQKFPAFPNDAIETKYNFQSDTGLMSQTKNETDKNMWRVPTLRNIADTAPYFHNGKVNNLSEAVKIMAKLQLNVDLTSEQQESLVAFLQSLSGSIPQQTMPTLPPTKNTSIVKVN